MWSSLRSSLRLAARPLVAARPLARSGTGGGDRGLAPLLARGLCGAPPTPAAAAAHPYRVPQPWLGAYYTLREDDPRAMANREKLRGRRAPARCRFIMGAIEKQQTSAAIEAEPWRGHARTGKSFRVGETLEVTHRPSPQEAEERVVGMCIARHNRGLGSSFRLLCKVDNVAVEYQFMLFSPLLTDISVVAKAKKVVRRRSKLYFLRDRVSSLSFPRPTRLPKKA